MSSEQSELSLEEMLADPIVKLVMQRDGVVADDVRAIVAQARGRTLIHTSTIITQQNCEAEATN